MDHTAAAEKCCCKSEHFKREEPRGRGQTRDKKMFFARSKTAKCPSFLERCQHLILLLVLSSHAVRGQQDNRCFLDGGGSTETFFIKESLPVGSLLGTLRIIGAVGIDVDLRLEDAEGSPVDVERGTKNLFLARPLDKEGEEGPASVSANVLCDRIGANDPSFSIPVNIRVTDENDNAPKFVGAPYKLNISELTIVGSNIFNGIRAVDNDQPGPFSTVEYSIANDPLSSYVAFENPLEGSLVLTKHLDYETLQSFQVKILARDQGSPPQESETLVTINVQDADDQNPAFFYDHYDARLPEGPTEGQKLLVQPQDIRAFDKDIGLGSPVYYAFNANAEEYKYFELNRNTGHIYIKSDIPESDFLQPVTLVVKATQFDNPDRYAVTTLTVSRGGIFDSDLQFLQKKYDVKILENVPLNSVITTLLTNKPSDRRVHFYIKEKTLPGKEFSVNQKGDVILRKMLDYERKERYSFDVLATDGRRNDSARVDVTLLNINDWDPRFKYPQYEFYVSGPDAFPGFVVGKLDVHDGDKGDRVSLDIKGPYARVFTINNRGELAIEDLGYLNSSEAHIVIVAEDSGIPPRRASVPVVVKFAREVTARIQDTAPINNTMILVIFGIVLLLFFLVIITLAVYICKHKKKYNRRSPRLGSDPIGTKIMTNYLSNDFPRKAMMPGNRIGMDNPVFHRSDFTMNGGSRPGSASSRRSSSETLSSVPSGAQNHNGSAGTVLNPLNPRSGSQRYSKNQMLRMAVSTTNNTKVSPVTVIPVPPPTPSINSVGLPEVNHHSISADPMPNGYIHRSNGAIPRHGSVNSVASSITSDFRGSDVSLQQALRDNIMHNSSRDLNRIQWPRNSIPRRVKKLSWEDEYGTTSRDRDISTLTDPNVSVTPLEAGSAASEPQIGRAIYF